VSIQDRIRVRGRLLVAVVVTVAAASLLGTTGATAQQEGPPRDARVPESVLRYRQAFLADRQPLHYQTRIGATPCVDGFAGQWPCRNIDLGSYLPHSQIGGTGGNDIWGWTDPLTSKEYALVGQFSGTAFVDISNPVNPVYLGRLPSHTLTSTWRDLETFENYVFVVADAAANHGMQIFDLTQLRNVPDPPVIFSETAHYGQFANSHTLAINTATGFAYANGSNTCSGGPHMININNPLNPTFAGCDDTDGYSHDAQCVIYEGPDVQHQGREICFNSNENTLTIDDVTNKSNPTTISRTTYEGSAYTHQTWIREDHKYLAMDDELDEISFGHNFWTRIWDVRNLDQPTVRSIYKSPNVPAIDHNLYIKDNLIYESNYRSGLRVLGMGRELGYFDVYPADDAAAFNGTWSNYPFFASGNIIINGIEQGLYVVRPRAAIKGGPWPGLE
jgi:choice-of-anchor B domain-containing protein